MKTKLLFYLSVFAAANTYAATFTVSNLGDAGPGSLREAVTNANATGGTDIIDATGISGTITLISGELVITDDLVINGPGASILTIDGNNSDRIFSVNVGFHFTLNDITIQNGLAPGGAGGGGGGILAQGLSLTVSGCAIKNCTSGGDFGGGVYCYSGVITITNSTFSGNNAASGGGIYNIDGNMTLSNCTISGNNANLGGGISNTGTANLNMVNCTVSGNTAVMEGGGIAHWATLSMTNCTVANNICNNPGFGDGIYNEGNSLLLKNNIFYNPGENYADIGNETSGGYNICSDASMSGFLSNSGDMNSTDPLLDVLANYGGLTQTHALNCGSPAINNGDGIGAPATDQRGQTRDGNTDIGAFESNPAKIPSSSTFSAVACNSYTSPSGNYAWTSSGTYTDIIPNAAGCDSVITINLTVDHMPFITSWSNGYNPGYMLLRGMFLNDTLGWSTYYAWDIPAFYIAKTTDGGLTQSSSGIPSAAILDVAFTDADTGFAVGNSPGGDMIARTTDGGQNWNPVSYPTGQINQLNRVVFYDALNGTTAGYGGAIYSTNDGGINWNYNIIDAGNKVFNDIDYVNNNIIWAVGYTYPGVEGVAYRSTDGGNTWTEMFSSTTTENFSCVKFVSPLNGFIAGGPVLFSTNDGGVSWDTLFVGAGDSFQDIQYGAGKYWLSGSNTGSAILYTSTDAVAWTPVSLFPAVSSTAFHIMIPGNDKVFINGDGLIIGDNNTFFNASATSTTICAGDTTLLIAEGADDYSWSNGGMNDSIYVSPTISTVYTVTGSSNSCSLNDSISITVLQPTAGTDSQTACNSYAWIDGNTYTSSTNTPTFTLTNAAGCDSIVTLDLTINTVNVTVTNSEPTLTANAAGAVYQWVDCNNGFVIISGETNQSFTASSNGDYAVIVTQNGCTDTSACENITSVFVTENGFGNGLVLYPNPTDGKLTLETGSNYSGLSVIIRNTLGQEIVNQNFTHPGRLELFVNGESGIYFIEIKSGDKQAVLKVVKR